MTPSHSATARAKANDADPAVAFVRVFRRMGLKRPLPDFRVEYHAYAGLRSTVLLRDNQVRVMTYLGSGGEDGVGNNGQSRPGAESGGCETPSPDTTR